MLIGDKQVRFTFFTKLLALYSLEKSAKGIAQILSLVLMLWDERFKDSLFLYRLLGF